MWIIYQIANLQIVGMTGHSSRELSREKALRGVLAAQSGAALADYAALQVVDEERVHEIMRAPPERLRLTGSPESPQVVVTEAREFYLQVSSDAPDVHPVDGIPEIHADGRSSTLISVQKIDAARAPVSGKEHADELFLRTDYGTLQDESGNDISRVRLESGKVAFRLKSEAAKRVATVRVFNADRELHDAVLQIEFI